MLQTIVILANSFKHKLRCVAGKSVKTGRWVRLVADPSGEAITIDQASFTNNYPGRFVCKPLKKVNMNLVHSVPLKHQPENYICEPGWVQNFRISTADLPQYEDNPDSLWGAGKRISEAEIVFGEDINQSLYLIKVDDLFLRRTDNEKRRVSFSYNHIEYDLPSTCPRFDEVLAGDFVPSNYIVVSLGELHTDGYHYKIIAAIM